MGVGRETARGIERQRDRAASEEGIQETRRTLALNRFTVSRTRISPVIEIFHTKSASVSTIRRNAIVTWPRQLTIRSEARNV